MKKCIFSVLMIMFLCILFAGYKSAQNRNQEYTIENIVIVYDYNDEVRRNIEIDFLSHEKIVKEFVDDESNIEKSDFNSDSELLNYLESSVIPDLKKANADRKLSQDSEERIVWRIKIVTNRGVISDAGLGDEKFPSYWADLLEYIDI